MFPTKEVAMQELEIAGQMNPGPWTKHSYHVAMAAKLIVEKCEGLDSNKAFVCGLLHDIGRRTGIAAVRHIIDGYDYAISKGWDEVAKVCLTHSFPVKDIEADIGKKDITKSQYERALATSKKLKKGLLSDIAAFKEYIQRLYAKVTI